MTYFQRALIIVTLLLVSSIKASPDSSSVCSVVQGLPGLNGRDGRDGQKGDTGPRGEPGIRGTIGSPGKSGPQGEKGLPGDKGQKGDQGIAAPVPPSIQRQINEMKERLTKLEKALHLHGTITQANNKIFVTNGKEELFTTCKNICSNISGRLATPMNEVENNAILEIVKQFNEYAYLGIQEGSTPGTFQYLDGQKLQYKNWYGGNPSGTGPCVEMYTDGTWNVKPCNYNRLIVCEL